MILKVFISPVLANSKVPPIAEGKPTTIPENIIIDIPLPIPLSVTCSPNHIRKTVPETKDTAVIKIKWIPGFVTTGTPDAV